jgi:hypothetical protein
MTRIPAPAQANGWRVAQSRAADWLRSEPSVVVIVLFDGFIPTSEEITGDETEPIEAEGPRNVYGGN